MFCCSWNSHLMDSRACWKLWWSKKYYIIKYVDVGFVRRSLCCVFFFRPGAWCVIRRTMFVLSAEWTNDGYGMWMNEWNIRICRTNILIQCFENVIYLHVTLPLECDTPTHWNTKHSWCLQKYCRIWVFPYHCRMGDVPQSDVVTASTCEVLVIKSVHVCMADEYE